MYSTTFPTMYLAIFSFPLLFSSQSKDLPYYSSWNSLT